MRRNTRGIRGRGRISSTCTNYGFKRSECPFAFASGMPAFPSPKSASRAFIFGSASAVLIPSFSLTIISTGVSLYRGLRVVVDATPAGLDEAKAGVPARASLAGGEPGMKRMWLVASEILLLTCVMVNESAAQSAARGVGVGYRNVGVNRGVAFRRGILPGAAFQTRGIPEAEGLRAVPIVASFGVRSRAPLRGGEARRVGAA